MSFVVLPALLSAQSPARLSYPDTRKADVSDDYFGTRIADPYRWLEDPNSAETQAWVDAQNAVTEAFLERIPARALASGSGSPRSGTTSATASRRSEGARYVFCAERRTAEPGGRSTRRRRSTTRPACFIDPNTLSKDGTVALERPRVHRRRRARGLRGVGGGLGLARMARARRGVRRRPAGRGEVVEVLGRRVAEGRLGLLLQPLRRARRTARPTAASTSTRRSTSTRSARRRRATRSSTRATTSPTGASPRASPRTGATSSSRSGRARTARTASSCATSPRPGQRHRAVPRRLRRELLGRRQRRLDVLHPHRQRRRAPSAGRHRPRAPRPVAVEDARSPSCPGRDVLAGVAMAATASSSQVRTDAHETAAGPRQGRPVRARGRRCPALGADRRPLGAPPTTPRRSTPSRRSRIRPPSTGSTRRPGQSTRLQAAHGEVLAGGLRDRAGVLHLEGRHARADVHRPPQGPRARRPGADASSTATAASTSR